MASEMEPFRSSFSRTADAAEYCWEGGVEMREVCIMIVRAAFCTASVTSLHYRSECVEKDTTQTRGHVADLALLKTRAGP
jgi:hypothetical protein